MKSIEDVSKEIKYGDVFTTEKFAEYVKSGCFIPYDGSGYYHDGEKKTDIPVDFNYKLMLKKAKEYPYVCWYNK